MIKFKSFINEMAFFTAEDNETKKVMEMVKSLGNQMLLWRGQNAGRRIGKIVLRYSGVVKVTADRAAFKGKMNDFVSYIIAKLGMIDPVFCSFDRAKAKFFGSVGVVLPLPGSTFLWNKDVDDLLSGEYNGIESTWDVITTDMKKIADDLIKNYKQTDDLSAVKDFNDEIIIKCKSYYWITPNKYIEYAKKAPNSKFKTLDDVHTYSDLYELYQSYISYIDQYKKNAAKYQDHNYEVS